jgi:hypothetical protein
MSAPLQKPAPAATLFQRLPPPPERHSASRVFQPSAKDIAAYPVEVQPLIVEAMQASILFGLARVLDLPYRIPQHLLENLAVTQMMTTNTGRCLWNWADIPAELPDVLKVWALRPSSTLPPVMQEVSPRVVVDMLGTFAATERLVGHGLKYLDVKLGLTGYGVEQDARLPRLDRLPALVPTSSIYSATAMTKADMPGTFAESLADTTSYRFGLGHKLRALENEVCEQAFAAITSPEGPEPDCTALGEGEYLLARLHKAYGDTVDQLMRKPWALDLTAGLSEFEYGPVIRRLLIVKFRCMERQVITGAQLLQLSYLSGISPAAFIRYAIYDAGRRDTTFTNPQAVNQLVSLIEEEVHSLSGMFAASARNLADELRRLSPQLAEALSAPNELLCTLKTPEVAFPEWGLGRKRAASNKVRRQTLEERLAAEDTDEDSPL